MDNKVIVVDGIKKLYKLYDKPMNRLKESLSLTHKKYHTEHFALDKIDFSVNKGECLGIINPAENNNRRVKSYGG